MDVSKAQISIKMLLVIMVVIMLVVAAFIWTQQPAAEETTVPTAFCGDGECGPEEDCSSCPGDCGICPYCGDLVCESGETCSDCPEDCGDCCGNGVLDPGEECEGFDTGTETCQSRGFFTGTLLCTDSCTFDTSNCHMEGDDILTYI